MAELVTKIGDGGKYDGNDVVCAFNRRRIRLVHADMICWPRIGGRKVGGQLGDTQPLLEKFYQRTAQYKWERVSRDQIKRTNLWTLDEVIFGSTPIDDPDRSGHKIHCHVEEHFEFRNESGKLPLFGAEDREILYGGRSKRDAATVELIWDDIESATPLRRVDHDRMPLSQESGPVEITLELLDEEQRDRLLALGRTPPFEIKYFGADRQYHVADEGNRVMAILGGDTSRHFLWLSVDEFDDVEAEELVSPLTKVVPVTAEYPDGIELVKKRKHYIDWQADVASSVSVSASIADIEDRTKKVDVRAEHTFSRASIIKTKSVK